MILSLFSYFFLPPTANIAEGFIKIGPRLVLYLLWDAVCSLRNTVGDGGKGVAVAAQRDGVTNRVL